jgi:transposase-like protein
MILAATRSMESHQTIAHICSKAFSIRSGRFYRHSEARWIQRYKCKECGRNFSNATGTLEFRQKKRRVNLSLFRLLCAGVSMRRSAFLLDIDRRTVDRKLAYLAKKSRLNHAQFLAQIKGSVKSFEFDDLITSEHTKMKPLSVSLAVDANRRFILGAKVGRIPAFGLIAEKSRQKYGRRKSEHRRTLTELFEEVAATVAPKALIQSDEHTSYPEFVKKYLPGREHLRHPGGRGAIVGQGELKKKVFDPIFTLNHSCAMLRAGINRLIRKTWCTTKRPDRLQMHLDIFLDFYNRIYLPAHR